VVARADIQTAVSSAVVAAPRMLSEKLEFRIYHKWKASNGIVVFSWQ
jgi:hypothetical protein